MAGQGKEPEKKPEIAETIIVEGRYDKNTLSQIVDAHIVETQGFGIFSDKELLDMIKKLAKGAGVIIMTDGDGAGFVIRNYLKGALREGRVLNAYIPDIKGRERRKEKSSSEGKLGVEGMQREIIIKSLRDAGATFTGEGEENRAQSRAIQKVDLFLAGLSGAPDSSQRRRELKKRLGLPERMGSTAFLQALNSLYTYEEFMACLAELDDNSRSGNST